MISSTMEKYCGSRFWNQTQTWESYDPDFTKCFEKTVLVWIPCLFLWLFSSFDVYYIVHSKFKDVPWNFLNISKLTITVLLIVLSIIDMASTIRYASYEEIKIYKVDIYGPVLKILTFALSAVLLIYNRKHGLRTSGLQFLFWLLAVLCATPQFRTEIREAQEQTPNPYFLLISYMIYYPLLILMLLLNCFADKPPRVSEYEKTDKPCPEEGASFLSRMFYQWFDIFIWRGFKKPLENSDLWNLNRVDTAQEVVPVFDKYWKKLVEKNKSDAPHHYSRAAFKSDSARVDFVHNIKKKEVSILPVLFKTFGPSLLFGIMLKVIQTILIFVSPQILRWLITFVETKEPLRWKGYLFAGGLFVTAVLQTVVVSQYFQRMSLIGMRIRTVLISSIYKKALRMSNSAKKESTVGEIVNLMSVDSQMFVELMPYINIIWSAPLEMALALYFLWDILGISVLAGLAIMILLIPVNGFISNRMSSLQLQQLQNKDARVKLMNEVLNGIKVLKLYAWEPSFEAQISKIRNKEIKVLKKAAFVHAGMSFIWSVAPYLVTLLTFITFIHSDETNVLTPQIAFVSLSLFATLHFVMGAFPLVVVWATEAWVSIKRINKFMNLEELDPDNVQHDASERFPVVIENGTFSWGEEPILKNINVQFEKGGLTAIVGSVGSGKTSLISALLGDMDKVSGRVNTIGSVAYVAQQAWIQNATLQDNILFGKTMVKKIYKNIVEACALKQDFEMLQGGDQTEIGEKGINVSGGQKQRISLARAAYSDADIYLLDDPLSAVDSHVGKHIFEKVIGPQGILKHTTRLLVTHSVTYLPVVDKIIVLKDGEVSEVGTYLELLERKGAFADFLNQYLSEVAEKEEDDDVLDELKNQLSGSSISKVTKKLTRQRSAVSESASEAGSDKANGALQRKKSTDKEGAGEKLIEEEKMETGSVKWHVYKHYFKSLGLCMTMAVIVFNVLIHTFNIGSNMWLGVWSEDKNATPSERDVYLSVYGALGFAQVLSSFFAALILFIGALNGAYLLHNLLLSNILKAPCNVFFDVTPVGRILNRFSQDIDALDSSLPMVIRGFNNCFFGVLATLVVITYTTPIFIAVIIPISIMYYFVQRFYVATSRQLKRLESVSRPPIYSHFSETVTGAAAIRAYGVTERFIKESEAKVDFNQVCNYPTIIATRWLTVRLEVLGSFIIFFAALFAVLNEEQHPGLVGLSIVYALQITQTLSLLVQMSSDVETSIVAVERIKEYSEVVQEAPWDIPNKRPSKIWPEIGSVAFRDYSVSYRPGLDLVLKNINFSVRGGEKVGIVGRTGAGKSSLTLSLFRIIEASQGEIVIDGINIAGIGLHALRSHLTIIPQDAVLFSGSLRMNLDPFEKYNDEDVWRSLEHANLKEFVKGLPAGLNHEVTEGGENLSVGQRQLVCLSRALLRKTKVLILDEATAAVDLETDDLIQRTIRTEFSNCTILTIAHRLNTIMDSDRVIVLDKGKVVEFDSPGSLLLNRQSIFYGMAKDAGLV